MSPIRRRYREVCRLGRSGRGLFAGIRPVPLKVWARDIARWHSGSMGDAARSWLRSKGQPIALNIGEAEG